MRGFIQLVCVVVLAVGAGMLAFSNKLEPQFNISDPTMLVRSTMTFEDRDQLFTASVTGGIGIGLMLLGSLGMVIPWGNMLVAGMSGELGDNSARTISLITIWISVAVVLTFGVFRLNWSGGAGLSVVLLIVALICSAATVGTALVCGWSPWGRERQKQTEQV